jgi:hypothetical protein
LVFVIGVGLTVLGVVIAAGVLGPADLAGLGVAGFGLALAFIAWKRVWDELLGFLLP